MDQKTAGVQYKNISGIMKNTIILRVEACRNEVLIYATAPTLKTYAKWKVTKSLKSNKKTILNDSIYINIQNRHVHGVGK